MKFTGKKDNQMIGIIKEYHNEFLSKLPPEEKEVLESLTVELSSRLKTSAGIAYTARNLIKLHYGLLFNNQDQIKQVYGHELAHVVAYIRYGSTAAGPGTMWQEVMWQLGLNPERCHNMDVSKFSNKKKLYCESCGKSVSVSTRKYNMVKKGQKKYLHKCSFRGKMITEEELNELYKVVS